MNTKLLGAALVIGGCGSFGFFLAFQHRHQEQVLRQLLRILRLMQWELQYRLTALPELVKMAGKECGGTLRSVMLEFARELDRNSCPDAYSCIHEALRKNTDLPPKAKKLLRQLGKTFGKYDLEGQLQGLEDLRTECRDAIAQLEADRTQRLRSYQTLGICAGAALAILFA